MIPIIKKAMALLMKNTLSKKITIKIINLKC
jgi:hypothetical protein